MGNAVFHLDRMMTRRLAKNKDKGENSVLLSPLLHGIVVMTVTVTMGLSDTSIPTTVV